MPFGPTRKLNVIMAGGLGNQLFQLYAGLDFATKTGRALVLDYSHFHKGFTKREDKIPEDVLRSISYDVTFSSKTSSQKVRVLIDSFSARMMRFFRKQKFFKRGQTYEIGYAADFNYAQLNRISGYFQTWRHYSSLIASAYVAGIKLQDPSENFKIWQLKINTEKPVIVHIRRGDYLSLSEKWGLLGYEYFKNAILSLVGQNPSAKILVFSDEPILALQLLDRGFFSNVEYFPSRSLRNDFEELLLMGQSDKIVISNSTFSWWAAQLGQTKNVVAPDKWFRGMDDPIDLIPETWTRIPSSWDQLDACSRVTPNNKAKSKVRVKECD